MLQKREQAPKCASKLPSLGAAMKKKNVIYSWHYKFKNQVAFIDISYQTSK
jgi:hypothetical protein